MMDVLIAVSRAGDRVPLSTAWRLAPSTLLMPTAISRGLYHYGLMVRRMHTATGLPARPGRTRLVSLTRTAPAARCVTGRATARRPYSAWSAPLVPAAAGPQPGSTAFPR